MKRNYLIVTLRLVLKSSLSSSFSQSKYYCKRGGTVKLNQAYPVPSNTVTPSRVAELTNFCLCVLDFQIGDFHLLCDWVHLSTQKQIV